jgi:hypothetical protein
VVPARSTGEGSEGNPHMPTCVRGAPSMRDAPVHPRPVGRGGARERDRQTDRQRGEGEGEREGETGATRGRECHLQPPAHKPRP